MLPRLPAGFDTYYEANATTASGASFIVQKKFYTCWGKEAPTAAPTYSFKGKGNCSTLDGKMPPRRAKGDGATYNDPFAGTEADCKVTPRCRVDVRARLTPTTPAPAPLGAEPECGEVWCSGSASPTQPHPPRARNAAAGHACRLPPPSSPHAAMSRRPDHLVCMHAHACSSPDERPRVPDGAAATTT